METLPYHSISFTISFLATSIGPIRELVYNACGTFKDPQLSSSVHLFGAGSLKTVKKYHSRTHPRGTRHIFRPAKMILNARTLFTTSAALAAALTAFGAPGYVGLLDEITAHIDIYPVADLHSARSRVYLHAILLRASCNQVQLQPTPW